MTAVEFADRFPRTYEVVQQGIERGLHHGAQIYISLRGMVLADVGLGNATPEEAMTTETVNPWLSAGKPMTAVLIAQLREAGELDWNDRVIKFIPEFGTHGKESITVRHLLTHTAGLRHIEALWPEVDWPASIQQICEASLPPNWVVGESAAYDPGCGWFLLGEIIQRLTGKPFETILQEQLLGPLELRNTRSSISPENHNRLQTKLGWMWDRQQGNTTPLDWHQAARCVRSSPGSSLRGPIRELGRFYEMLLNQGAAAQGAIISADSVRELTSRQRIGKFDETFGHIMDIGYGFLIDSNQYGAAKVTYGYGRNCSPRTYGHGGSQSSQGYCDPEQGLVVAYLFNGRPGEPQHQRRVRTFQEALQQDLAESA